MASVSPSPNSSPGAVPPASPSNSSPPPASNPNQNAPPPSVSPPPSTPSGSPPVTSPPPVSPPPQVTPPPPPQSSPPQSSPPPPVQPPTPTLPSSPPPPPVSPPAAPPVSPPPSSTPSPPPAINSPAPPIVQSPPPPSGIPPPRTPPPANPVPASPPSPAAPPPSPPPPRAITTPSPPTAPPPPRRGALPPRRSPASPSPPGSSPIPPTASPPSPSIASPPPPPPITSPSDSPPSPPIPSASPSTDPPPPFTNAPPIPSIPKPTASPSNPSAAADSSSSNNRGLTTGVVAVVVSSIVGLLALTLVILAVWRLHRRKKRNKYDLDNAMPSPFASSQNSDSSFLPSQYSAKGTGSGSGKNYIHSPDGGIGSSRSWFSYQELSGATNGFSRDNLLGEGGFGCVYKGILADGRQVAVKRLKAGGGQGEREFRAEVEIISRIHHRHLVSLVGYCIAEHQRLLVYDYVPNNTLHYHLHAEGKPVMDWVSRVRVAAGAARGIAYLHEDCQPRIIHRDIKSTNILLDNNFEARVADFGLAKLALELDLHTHVSTRVMGTFGYLAPEYASTGKLTEKSDVFSFGVVLLELITGRKPVDPSQPLGDESLVEWARPLLTQALEQENFTGLTDPRLENNFTAVEMFRMIEAAAACVRHSAAKRPRMSQIVRALDSMEEVADLSNGIKPGQSGLFSSREHSAQIRMFQRMAFGSQDFGSDIYTSQSSWGS